MRIFQKKTKHIVPSQIPDNQSDVINWHISHADDWTLYYITHRPLHYLDSREVGGVVLNNKSPNVELSGRISAAYKKQYNEQCMKGDGQWSKLVGLKLDVHEALMDDDIQKLSEILANPIENNLLHGFEDIAKIRMDDGRFNIYQTPYNREVTKCYDYFVRLGEACGVERLEYPGAYQYGAPKEPKNLQAILNNLNNFFSCKIAFPNPYRGEYGVKTSEGIATMRSLNAIYQAYAIFEKLGHKPGRVLEIGAGTGRTAYYAKSLFGIDYTIVDLPMSAVASAYHLGITLGEDAVSLYGETKQHNAVQILPPESLLGDDLGRFDLIVNCDSLTEMDYDTMCAYWNKIIQCSSSFLSVNHESNEHTVREMLLEYPPRDYTYSRTPYWMRLGYVQEYVSIENA